MYKILNTDGMAKRAELVTLHGVIQTPVFMNVATQAAIKGALSSTDLMDVGCQVALCNTYHMHLRPGEEVVERLGGLRGFMAWDGPVLTDSGGFQVYSLAAKRKIEEEGVYFNSHIDGRKIFMGPEESIKIQSALGSTVAMAFDECAPYPCDKPYMRDSVDRTTRWLKRCMFQFMSLRGMKRRSNPVEALRYEKHGLLRNDRNGKLENQEQMLFGINQGGTYADIRIEHAKTISEMDLDGYALGGLAVGEPAEKMYEVLEQTVPHLPKEKPTYLMGVGTPENILEAVERGIDFFDCVMPARNGRHGHAFTSNGKINLKNAKHEFDDSPIDNSCACSTCKTHSRAYIRHLLKAGEMLGMRLAVLHNLFFYNKLMADIRESIEAGRFLEFKRKFNATTCVH